MKIFVNKNLETKTRIKYNITSSIKRLVIVAENHKRFLVFHRHLTDVRHEIRERLGWILANQSRLVCTNWIEVAQRDNVPSRVRLRHIF